MKLVIASFVFLLAVCSPAFAATPANNIFCEKTDGNGTERAKLVVKAGAGRTLFLCGYSEKKKHGHLEVSGIRVFAINKAGRKMPGQVFQDERELRHYWASKNGEALVLDELIWDGHEQIPVFETKIECTKEKGCKPSEPTCALQPPKSISKKALLQIHAYMSGAKKGKVPDESLIAKLAGLAYSGDKEAQAIFQERGSLMLDGAAGETFFEHQALLGRLKKTGCL